MDLPNIFTADVTDKVINRLSQLEGNKKPNWGKMNSGQMMAHCNVPYEMVFETKHAKPNLLVKFMLKAFVKDKVCGKAPYPKNSATAPAFIIKGDRDFEAERKRLIEYIKKTQQLGEKSFEGKESDSFGLLTVNEWNNMFYKHIDHHLTQFGV